MIFAKKRDKLSYEVQYIHRIAWVGISSALKGADLHSLGIELMKGLSGEIK